MPSLCEELLSSIDQPLKIAKDAASGRDYLLCDYNRDADSYRSPWSNKYDPPLEDGAVPSDSLRELEIQANQAFDTYRELYYEGGVSSVYLWDLQEGFAGVILIKKGACVCVCVSVCVCVCLSLSVPIPVCIFVGVSLFSLSLSLFLENEVRLT